MVSLAKIAQENPRWSLEDFVFVTNQFLPKYLPIAKNNTRIREEINPRLVRHYTSQGMLDEPLKSGKFAVYTYRHLLQLLVVRRLLSEGIGSNAIDHLAIQKSNLELENLLTGGVLLEITPANPALSYQQKSNDRGLRAAENIGTQDYTVEDALSRFGASFDSYSWSRLEALSGLELHIRSDFIVPPTPEEQALLRDHLWQILEQGSQRNTQRNKKEK
jgi:DNA-binding transcriptional MerR regulator